MDKPIIDPIHSAETYNFAGKDVSWLWRKQATERGGNTFLIWEPKNGTADSEASTWTYSEFYLQMRQVACGLIAQGVKKGR